MGRLMYKNRPGGYMTMPIVVTRNTGLSIDEKFVLCFIMGFWINKSDSLFSLGYISSSLGMSVDSVKTSINKLSLLGLVKVSNKRLTKSDDTMFNVSIEIRKVNSFFGCELIGTNEPAGRETPGVQPIRKQIMKIDDPLAWMESEYYKNR